LLATLATGVPVFWQRAKTSGPVDEHREGAGFETARATVYHNFSERHTRNSLRQRFVPKQKNADSSCREKTPACVLEKRCLIVIPQLRVK